MEQSLQTRSERLGRQRLMPLRSRARWFGPAVLLLVLVGVLAATVVWQGQELVWASLQRLGGAAVAVGASLTLLSLVLRGLRWQTLLRRLGHSLPMTVTLRSYLAGLALSATPGKVGETSRSVLLHPFGVPVAHSLAAFVADRGADVIGVAFVGAVASWLMASRQPLIEVVFWTALLGSLFVASLWRRQGARWLRGRRGSMFAGPMDAWARTWEGSGPWLYILVSVLWFALQVAVFGHFVTVFPDAPGWATLASIYASSTLIGAASMLPSGLGAMDVALVVQLQAQGMAGHDALSAALATRACTLGVAWIVGLLALLSFSSGTRESQ